MSYELKQTPLVKTNGVFVGNETGSRFSAVGVIYPPLVYLIIKHKIAFFA